MDVQHIERLLYYRTHSLCGLELQERPNCRVKAPGRHQSFSDTNSVYIYCKPVYTCTSLFGAQLRMTVEAHVLCGCILHTKNGFTANGASFYEQSWLATLHVLVSCQLIVYANITTVYTTL